MNKAANLEQPIDENLNFWDEVIDFTQIKEGEVGIEEILVRL